MGSLLRPLRWHERILIALLSRCPGVDELLIIQYPGNRQERRQMVLQAQAMRFRQVQEEEALRLERIYHQSPESND